MEKFEEVTKKGAKKKDVSAPASTVARAFPRGGDRAARDRSSPEGLHRDSPGRQPLTARLTFPVPSPRPQAPKPAPQGAKPAGRRDRDRPRDGKREERRGACDRSELAPRPTPRVPARHLAAPRRKIRMRFFRPTRSPVPAPAPRRLSRDVDRDADRCARFPSPFIVTTGGKAAGAGAGKGIPAPKNAAPARPAPQVAAPNKAHAQAAPAPAPAPAPGAGPGTPAPVAPKWGSGTTAADIVRGGRAQPPAPQVSPVPDHPGPTNRNRIDRRYLLFSRARFGLD